MVEPVEEAPRFPFVVVDASEGDEAEEMSALLFELGAQGVEERDATTLVKGTAGKVTLVASFETHEAARAAIGEIDARFAPRIEEIIGDAWRDAWKEHFRPFAVCEGMVIRPPWETYDAKPGEEVLELEPGRAFGTGLHETTSLVAQALRAHAREIAGRHILDVGCGSGILALLALKMGAAHARAVDVDGEAIDVARENAARNGMSDRLDADTTDVNDLGDAYPVVVANIEARVLVPMAPALMKRVLPTGLLVLSGVLAPQLGDVRAAYGTFELLDAPQKGEWVALVLRAASASGASGARS
jgi:ribosomal protein L11 methyltransferase